MEIRGDEVSSLESRMLVPSAFWGVFYSGERDYAGLMGHSGGLGKGEL